MEPAPSAPKSAPWTLWFGLALLAVTVAVIVALFQLKRDYVARQNTLPVIHTLAPFTLTNQAGQPVTLDTLRGRVWVGDIIFTRCAGPCPIMTRQMRELQDALPRDSRAALVTLTTDADYDTPEVLAAYAAKFGADPARWQFLTGDKVAVANLAIDGLKLTTLAKPPEERTDPADLFVHATIFVVVDKLGRLRGSFETQGDHVNWPEVKQRILAAVKQLEQEP
ncbi:MAG: SCO family protein [Limisphaerales bacterium]